MLKEEGEMRRMRHDAMVERKEEEKAESAETEGEGEKEESSSGGARPFHA